MYKYICKVVIKILQGSTVNKVPNRVRWANYSYPSCKFPIVCMPK